MGDVRLIDANALIKKFEDDGLGDYSLLESVFAAGVYAGIENAPTIDAVPVVRCRECWRHQTANCPMFLRGGDYACHDGFCHLGAKMDGGAENGR